MICEKCGAETGTLYLSVKEKKQVCEECEFNPDTNENKNSNK